jgi:hypothetical protein
MHFRRQTGRHYVILFGMKNDPLNNEIRRTTIETNLDTMKALGFRIGQKGTHTTRTIMLSELEALFQSCDSESKREEYANAIINQNCLGKHTAATRKLCNQRLGELYGLSSDITIFRYMRFLWQSDFSSHPILALLITLARDPLLRITADTILNMNPGEELARQKLKDALRDTTAERFNENTLDKVVRNTAASWTQSGHLRGRSRKIRQEIQPTPGTVAYALFLGFVLGKRGIKLFETLWTKTLGKSVDELMAYTFDAKRLGLLDLSHSGGVIEISFTRILTKKERYLIHGTN